MWYDSGLSEMPRYPSPSLSSYSFGPGPLSTALKGLIGANVAMFFAQQIVLPLTSELGLIPGLVIQRFWVWQVFTYMFLHGNLLHILFNMLALWMFGTELERIWGTRYFLKFYFVTGVGAAILTVFLSVLPFDFSRGLYASNIIGASGAIYGLLLAYALYFPNRPIYMYFLFPVPAKIFVLIMGAIAFYASLSGAAGGTANATHLGGLLVAYLFLKTPRLRLSPWAEVKYRYLKWRINRVRKKFDVYSGGRADDWDRRVH
jgi:membrane associated rhomboid family serine protease